MEGQDEVGKMVCVTVGPYDGKHVGATEEDLLGERVGSIKGLNVGLHDFWMEGVRDGSMEGPVVEGVEVGLLLGILVGL